MSTDNAPTARSSHTAIWTGSEMIVWGYVSILGFATTGGKYDPNTDNWIPTNTYDVPEARSSQTAVWTGTEMIIWGGVTGNNAYPVVGGRYKILPPILGLERVLTAPPPVVCFTRQFGPGMR